MLFLTASLKKEEKTIQLNMWKNNRVINLTEAKYWLFNFFFFIQDKNVAVVFHWENDSVQGLFFHSEISVKCPNFD